MSSDFLLSVLKTGASFERASRHDDIIPWLIVVIVLLFIYVIALFISAPASQEDSYIELKCLDANGRVRTSLGVLKEFAKPSDVRGILGALYHFESRERFEFYKTVNYIKIFDLIFDCIVAFKNDQLDIVLLTPTEAMVEKFASAENGMTTLNQKMQKLYERLTLGIGKERNGNKWRKELEYSLCCLADFDKDKPQLYIGFSHSKE